MAVAAALFSGGADDADAKLALAWALAGAAPELRHYAARVLADLEEGAAGTGGPAPREVRWLALSCRVMIDPDLPAGTFASLRQSFQEELSALPPASTADAVTPTLDVIGMLAGNLALERQRSYGQFFAAALERAAAVPVLRRWAAFVAAESRVRNALRRGSAERHLKELLRDAVDRAQAWLEQGEDIPPHATRSDVLASLEALGVAVGDDGVRLWSAARRAVLASPPRFLMERLARGDGPALEAVAEAVYRAPGSTPRTDALWLGLVRGVLAARGAEEALGVAVRAVQAGAELGDLWRLKAELELETGRHAAAEETARRELERGRDRLAWLPVLQDCAEARGGVPALPDPEAFDAETLLRAVAAFRGGAMDSAIGFLRAYVAARPDHVGAWLLLGHALRRGSQPEEAVEAYAKAVALSANRQQRLKHVYLLGRAAMDAGLWSRASAAFRQALRIRPRHLVVQGFQGICLLRLERPGQALPLLAAAADSDSLGDLFAGYETLAHVAREGASAYSLQRRVEELRNARPANRDLVAASLNLERRQPTTNARELVATGRLWPDLAPWVEFSDNVIRARNNLRRDMRKAAGLYVERCWDQGEALLRDSRWLRPPFASRASVLRDLVALAGMLGDGQRRARYLFMHVAENPNDERLVSDLEAAIGPDTVDIIQARLEEEIRRLAVGRPSAKRTLEDTGDAGDGEDGGQLGDDEDDVADEGAARLPEAGAAAPWHRLLARVHLFKGDRQAALVALNHYVALMRLDLTGFLLKAEVELDLGDSAAAELTLLRSHRLVRHNPDLEVSYATLRDRVTGALGRGLQAVNEVNFHLDFKPSAIVIPPAFRSTLTRREVLRCRPTLRESGRVHWTVLRALLVREMLSRFGRTKLGYLWAFLPPMLLTLLLFSVFSFVGRQTPEGVSLLGFLITGITAFQGFATLSAQMSAAINSNRPLLYFRQVSLFSLLTGRFILDSLTNLTIFATLALALPLTGAPLEIDAPLQVLAALFGMHLLGAVIGILMGVGSEYFPALAQIRAVIVRVLFLSSGIFFYANELPPNVRDLLLLNPLFHCLELLRDGFFPTYTSDYGSGAYIAAWVGGGLFLAFSLERIGRRRILEAK